MQNKVVITGSSGYLGRRLVDEFLRSGSSVLGLDISPDEDANPDLQFVRADVTSPSIRSCISDFEPDVIIHSAFVFQPQRNENWMRKQNLGAFDNLSRIVAEVSPGVFHIVSSATVYGTKPGRIDALDESTAFQPSQFQYAADKQGN